ncbi:MAG: cirA 7 [Sphingomonas bacterium]|jgi:iron complex outermembrane receptor protein|nr:cirA 7 [Sphingomonas bacterium]MDB5683656.1 cirA 7 [Sphingomonas bacterium]MDB5717075.1 cirA 7 [Sphingomonas bacterium]
MSAALSQGDVSMLRRSDDRAAGLATATSRTALALALLVGAGIAHAQDPEQTPAAPPSTATAAAAPAGSAEGGADQDIIVTGSRLGRSGFTTPTPVTVVGEQEIARQGAPNIAEVLNQVPAFRAQSTPSTSAIFVSNIGASTADLRGLGANRTLVLIDGRRAVPATVQGGSFTPAFTVDLNMVPTSLIQRSEVVTGGASAAYGSDAVAGVVNLILNKDLTGIRGNVQYGLTERGDNQELLASLAAGTRFADDRGRIIAGVEYVDNKGAGDCYSRSWCAESYNTISNPGNAGGLARTLILPNARTATATRAGIVAGVNRLLPNAAGVLVPTAIATPLRGLEFGPNNTTFRHDYGQYFPSNPAATNGGIFQSGGGDPTLAFYENFPISAPVERVNAFSHVDFELSDGFSVFGEGSYGHVSASVVGAQRRDLGNITIRRDNAYLQSLYPQIVAQLQPTDTIVLGRIYNDVGPQTGEVKRETYRLVGGFDGDLGGSWKVDGYYQYGRTNYSQRGYNTTITPRVNFALDAVRDASGNIVCAATIPGGPRFNAAAAGCVPFNPLGENNFSPASKAYITGTAMQDTAITQNVAALTVRGDLFNLWAGPLSVAAGGEYRVDEAHGTTDPISAANQFYTSPGASIDGKIKVKEAFVEAQLPLAKDLPFLKTLEINAAGRITDYSTSGSVETWKVGLVWEPVEWLRVRGTRSRDIRAPNVFELFGPRQSSFQTVIDPARGGTQNLPQVFLVGSSGLVPEVADTYSAGIVLQPEIGVGRFRAAVDWFDISLNGAISTLGSQVIVNRCASATVTLPNCSDLVTRAGNSPTGEILSVANANLNLNRLITRGVDMEASYTLPLSALSATMDGSVSLRVLGTYIKDLITVDSSGVAIDRAGQNGSGVSQASGVPRVQLNSYLTYDADPFSTQLQVRYISKGRYDRTRIGPDEDGYLATLPNSINDNSVGSRIYVNLNAQMAVINDGKRRVELYGAVNNLLDQDPPKDIPSSFGPTNNVLYDVVGRSFRVGFRFSY